MYPTEKTWKCVVTKTHWIAFAGKHTYSMLADFGIRSILELVPGGIEFDNITSHTKRFESQVNSIKYLNKHQELLHTVEANNILNSNYENFFTNSDCLMPLINKLDKIIKKHT